jgi:crotonobetainyl-CoA:carnitine CoA-transferase CaiB-like acyl-CoA transferase
MSGVSMLTGSPDSPPGSVNTSYSDYHTGVFQPLAVIGALLRRRATGQPITMESSILKSGAATAGPGILDFQVNQRLPQRMGNRDPAAASHGVYPCSTPETYCAIAVSTEAERAGLCQAIDNPDWCASPEFATPMERLKNREALDELLATWTSHHQAEEVMKLMQGAGVPASVVSRGEDLYNSPHLNERGFHQKTRYFLAEKRKLASRWQEDEGIGWKMPVNMSRTPMEFGHYSNIGEDNPYVFGDLLGLSQGEIQQLSADGIIV